MNLETIQFRTGDAYWIFPFQRTDTAIYLFVDSPSVFVDYDVVKDFKNCIVQLARNAGGLVILSGRVLGCLWLREDLRDLYTGLPDDFTIEGAYGMRLKQKPERIKINGVDFDIVSLSEIGLRKSASILGWQKGVKGLEFGPDPGREPDVVDFYLILLTLTSEKEANEWAISYRLEEFVKTKLPDIYEKMKASKILG